MACLNTVTIFCIFAALVGQGATTTSKKVTTTGLVTTTGQPTTTAKATTTVTTIATTADQGTTTTTTAKATTTVTTTAYQHTYSGSLIMTATDVTKDQMETALADTFASQFNVSASAVSVTATESRRLAQSALRKLAGTWTISFTIKVLEHQKTSMDTKVSTVLADTTSLTAALGTHLIAAGAPQSAVASLQVSSVTIVLVTTTTTTATTKTTTAEATATATATGTTTKTMKATTTQFLAVPVAGGACLRETAFLFVILLSTTMMTLSGM